MILNDTGRLYLLAGQVWYAESAIEWSRCLLWNAPGLVWWSNTDDSFDCTHLLEQQAGRGSQLNGIIPWHLYLGVNSRTNSIEQCPGARVSERSDFSDSRSKSSAPVTHEIDPLENLNLAHFSNYLHCFDILQAIECSIGESFDVIVVQW